MIQYERFNQTEKQLFKRLVNQLLAKTFLLRDDYDLSEGRLKVHPDYRFVERTYEVFVGYFELGGWTLHRDSQYGVIYLNSAHDYNRVHFNKFTTLMLLTMRLIFEERREEVSLRNEVVFTASELIEKMNILGIIEKKPSMKDILEGFKILNSFNVINKIDGKWDAPDSRYMILPSILFVIPNDKISMFSELSQTKEDEVTSDYRVESMDEDDDIMEDLL